ncbi:IS1182 family transposase [Flavobacterium kingsejongi]|uniref:IS5/IS1182 family transposase n=2 Tax=Flavobacterium TaxID=237 RepID=A0A2S1LL61_9FLAO|nr:IS1182 family transposase [Flavobacterium kingsejongi]AWG23801.1 IS5/IS1182 family transposase [Flavobacterium kingsejongi]AWG24126.1 IS5/IS1182 family transposase [Flavobacterium kingsejongi]AWG24490.1 IS5/IS1182 family transposase [Flavobacterium kingsejongi]AWG25528.1 IS5/IS1182 family transposase [Flavobacterium kingsejongi]AWG26595.1 IS5/IS1182 family transposase [Flavobacterium kingsejongi]
MRFKHYNQQQTMLLPYSFDDLIPHTHAVRIVDQVVESLNIQPLLKAYSKEGNPGYHPKMLLKVMLYAYMTNIYSSRKIELALRENINFMWLTSMTIVDHNTINRFRSDKLKESFKEIFKQVVLMLASEGLVNLKQIYTDGTKIEAQAGRYTFVWGKSIKTNKAKMLTQLEELWNYAQSIDNEDDPNPEPTEFKEISKEVIEKTVAKIDAKLSGNEKTSSKAKAKLRYIKNNFTSNLEKYEKQEAILGERNSYSKTDTQATFMRMKEDHMLNGQLKPAYNTQISTQNQIIVHYTIHQNPTDTKTLQPHLENLEQTFGKKVFKKIKEITTDAGYGSEENYDYLKQKKLKAFVKYNTFEKEQDQNYQKKHKAFSKENLYYNPEEDYYVCPMGQKMHKTYQNQKTTTTGYTQTLSHYQAKNCEGCSLRGQCFKAQGNRSIERNHNLERHKQQARELLLSEIGIQRRKQRSADVEPVFAQLKHNNGFRRFSLKGLQKVELEFGLMALGHNLRKKIAA